MGALDDAIREHLELKRRHGASEDEIQRAEAEALGPARREPGADPYVDEAGMSAPPPPPVAFDDRFDEPLHAVVDEPPPLPGEAVEDAPPPPPPDSVPLDPTALRALPGEPELEPVETEPVDLHPVEEAPVEEAPIEDAPVEEPPVEHDDSLHEVPAPPIHHEPGPDEPPAPARPPGSDMSQEDVLEETPEFLQDTPDHDRLWFEQKPPRDFDLDD
jgi:hypothetical protein